MAAVVLGAATTLARAADDDGKAAAKKLEGTYQLVELRVGGKPDSKGDEVKSIVIKDGVITIQAGDRNESAKFTIDPSKKPAQIDIVPGSDKTVPGIYQTRETDKGLELTIAFRKGSDAERPKDFKGEGQDDVVLKLLRKK
jgi:uncharacterized protein (TIGR03067 family)